MYILTEQELEQIRSSKPFSRQRSLYVSIRKRAHRNTRVPGLVQPDDTVQMEHLCWERMSAAALVWAVEKDARIGKWIHDAVLDMAHLDDDEWIGPWFRKRDGSYTGQLETAHMVLAVCSALDLCGELFSEAEVDELKLILREKGMIPCRRYLIRTMEAGTHINNWFAVLLNGYGTAAVILQDEEAKAEAVQYLQLVSALFQEDSYGESLQYANYTCKHFCHLMEVLLRAGEKPEDLPLNTPPKMIPWMAASYLYRKPLSKVESLPVPQSLNFGDSGAVFRPTGDYLAFCAAVTKVQMPREAALAADLFDKVYAEPELPFDERSEFGFFNHFSIHAVAHAHDFQTPRSPQDIGQPLMQVFQNGNICVRDRWENPNLVLGFRGGYQSLNSSSHSHEDTNSFMLSSFGERILIDPGHCCYRLRTQAFSLSAQAHNTWTLTRGGTEIRRKPIGGNFLARKEPAAVTRFAGQIGEAAVMTSDIAKAYGEDILKAERTLILYSPSILFVVDRIESTLPAAVHTRFWGNNRGNLLKVHVASFERLVFRRGDAALKLFSMGEKAQELSFDWGFVHDNYHPEPNQPCQGKEGSALGYCFSTLEECRHLNIYALALSPEFDIKGWHIYKDGNTIKVESPDKKYYKRLTFAWDALTFIDEQENRTDYHYGVE